MLKMKCHHCGRVSVLKTKVITPYFGKTILLNCGNPVCKLKLKVKVPEVN